MQKVRLVYDCEMPVRVRVRVMVLMIAHGTHADMKAVCDRARAQHVHLTLTLFPKHCFDLFKRLALRLRHTSFHKQPCAYAFDGEEEKDSCRAHSCLHFAEEHSENKRTRPINTRGNRTGKPAQTRGKDLAHQQPWDRAHSKGEKDDVAHHGKDGQGVGTVTVVEECHEQRRHGHATGRNVEQ